MKPIIVALCGHPGSGKSTVQEILHRRFGLIPFDDGAVLRRHCMELFGLSEEDVSTQEGKKRHTVIQGKSWENRKIIGEYGNALETLFGPMTVPHWAIKTALEDWEERQTLPECWRPLRGYPEVSGYSFGSVRRGQAAAYKAVGGIVIEIRREGLAPSGNIWDEYDQRLITHTFDNVMALHELEDAFCGFFERVRRDVVSQDKTVEAA
ncbi:MAG: hypothetical protein LPK02_07000 [Rhodobacterales bacterium]|nr:hypothetical protein [Rhodobacterales bacterium]